MLSFLGTPLTVRPAAGGLPGGKRRRSATKDLSARSFDSLPYGGRIRDSSGPGDHPVGSPRVAACGSCPPVDLRQRSRDVQLQGPPCIRRQTGFPLSLVENLVRLPLPGLNRVLGMGDGIPPDWRVTVKLYTTGTAAREVGVAPETIRSYASRGVSHRSGTLRGGNSSPRPHLERIREFRQRRTRSDDRT